MNDTGNIEEVEPGFLDNMHKNRDFQPRIRCLFDNFGYFLDDIMILILRKEISVVYFTQLSMSKTQEQDR